MKKVLMVLGGIFLLIVVLVVVGIVRTGFVHREAVTYLNEAVPAIVSEWSEQAFLDRITPALSDSISDDELLKLFVTFRKLGKLRSLDGPLGTVHAGITGKGSVARGQYEIPANFASGPALIRVTIIKTSGEWQISDFTIRSKVFE